MLNSIPGVSIDAIAQVTFATTASAENEANKQIRAENLTTYTNEINASQAERNAQIIQYRTEYENSLSAFKDAYANAQESAKVKNEANSINDFIADNTALTASNTSDINDTISTSSDNELEWLRKIAESETVNRFTTAEIKLDFSSSATLSSDMDIDGYINTFTKELQEVLVSTAEGLEK